MPILLKDNINFDKLPTTAGTHLLRNNKTSNAFIVDRIKEKGGIILGKANLSEWANFLCLGCPNGYSAGVERSFLGSLFLFLDNGDSHRGESQTKGKRAMAKREMSAKARKAIGDAQRKRWREFHKGNKGNHKTTGRKTTTARAKDSGVYLQMTVEELCAVKRQVDAAWKEARRIVR